MFGPYHFSTASWSLFVSAAFVAAVAFYALNGFAGSLGGRSCSSSGDERRGHLLALFQARPDLLLIHVDVHSHSILALSGRRLTEPSTQDLVQLIVEMPGLSV